MKTISNCPICEGSDFKQFLSCKDYTVSKDKFEIVECNNCKFRFTNPIPEENEIGKYYESEDYISHSNTSKSIIDKIYQQVRKYTIRKKYALISKNDKPKTLLDIGSGTGDFLNYCKHNGLIVKGIEPSKQAREASIRLGLDVFEENKLNELEEQSFDRITMWHVLEHVYHLNERIIQINRLLKNNGRLYVAVPNCSSFDAKYYKEIWAAYDVPRHLYHFRPEDVTKLFSKHNMKVVKTIPMKFDSYYVSMLSEKYKGGFLGIIKAMFIGFISNIMASGKNEYSSQIYVIEKSL